MTKNQFNELNLKTQLTNELKSKWYYKERKWGLRINKHSVVFDNTFKFTLKYVEPFIDDETNEEILPGSIVVEENNESLPSLYDSDNCYGYDKYLNDPKDILKDILVYIANCI